jgi:hypothetical protein
MPPFAPTMHVRLPVRAPDSPGRHELLLHLGGNGTGVAPAWRGTITVRPLYGATYRAEVPSRLPAGEAVVVPVYVTNEGMVAWEGPDFRLSYHWRDATSGAVVHRDGWRTYLLHAVAQARACPFAHGWRRPPPRGATSSSGTW